MKDDIIRTKFEKMTKNEKSKEGSKTPKNRGRRRNSANKALRLQSSSQIFWSFLDPHAVSLYAKGVVCKSPSTTLVNNLLFNPAVQAALDGEAVAGTHPAVASLVLVAAALGVVVPCAALNTVRAGTSVLEAGG